MKTKTHFEQIPIEEVVRELAKEELKIAEKRPATATVEVPSDSSLKTVDRI